jgi:predicted enzyme related to lactoylglutathione lyase
MTGTATSYGLLGRPVWYELLTMDTAAAEKFYTAVVGWTTAPFDGASAPYTVLNDKAGAGVGGIMRLPDGMNVPPHWVMYLGVPDIDQAIARIEQMGGRTLSPPIDVPDVGRMRTMLDPQGAMFSIIQPASDRERPETEPGLGDVAWHELYSDDPDAAMQFYGTMFGWRATEPAFDMGPMGKYHMFGRAFTLGGMMKKTPEMAQMPSMWGLYFRVDNVDAGAERVKANGGTVLNGPMDVPGGDRIVQCMDPQGAAFSLHQKPPS